MNKSLAIVEIAGRDSVAAAVAAVRERDLRNLLPTIAFTGTETGDRDAPMRAVRTLRLLVGEGVRVHDPVPLSDPAMWSAMCARPAAEMQRRFGMCSPCLACHLYFHLLRVPLAWSYDNPIVISGQRDSHDARISLAQTPAAIDAATRVLEYAGVTLIHPVRTLSEEEIAGLVRDGWNPEANRLCCQLESNYVNFDGTLTLDKAAYARYIGEFFEPVGRAVIDAGRAEREGGPATDFHAVVRKVLAG